MGSCFSSTTSSSAIVIAIDGSLQEHPVPVTVSSVLGSDHSSCFLCSSDDLFFDTSIPALDLKVFLQPGQIYFVLPIVRLDFPPSGSDMAALAVKASLAIAADTSKRYGRRRIQVTPVEEIDEVDGVERFKSSVGIRRMWGSVSSLYRSEDEHHC